ncbi:MAG: 23S rRNA (adenine(2030)-N(6))-methyltransferase RlmJ [Cohaesibacteraceae bacterium]|nr:23S rRNA (adenine(2030)-N(6))-methyltransferase RlmJ [Cohaesibacteraceae bacterium]MBL4876732.1 23S rRNA (adenine(2030)-N(6))-methyltransferase RlmJ [Cohaesibacteraceae bacterium]
MNYRHIYHAGNFADVVKHLTITSILTYLQRKSGPVSVLDTHAGLGLYDLTSEEASKTTEWQEGFNTFHKTFLANEFHPSIMAMIKPYMDLVTDCNDNQPIHTKYPGSPEIARKLLRKDDRLTCIELHPDDARNLGYNMQFDSRVRVRELDAWIAMKAELPPKIKRGLVLIDPPFERTSEFTDMLEGLKAGIKRWATGTYCLWYPIKHLDDTNQVARRLEALGIPKILRAELYVRSPSSSTSLNGTGMFIVNPTWPLENELRKLLPVLSKLFANGTGSGSRVDWITRENPTI